MIELVGPEGTSEYRAAVMVREALESIWPGIADSPMEEDLVRIAVSAKIPGRRVQDIDIVLVGRFSKPRQARPTRVIRGKSGARLNNRPLLVESFVVAIEVKDHDDRSVRVNEDQVEVKYGRSGPIKWKSATDQNVDQLHALKSFLTDQWADVFVRRCLVFPSLSSISSPSAVASGFTGHQLLSAIACTSPVLERKGQGVLSAGKIDQVEKALASPLFKRVIPTRLDRERMDRLAEKSPAVDDILDTLGTGTVFLRGYGGTGKTVLLLQAAWKLFRQEGKRTLILTYNLALAADMRRLMALMGIPSSADEGGIMVGTVMSFLYKWFARLHLLEDDELDYSKYPDLCASANEMITEGAVTKDDIEEIIASSPEQFDFDEVFVDEGQDWPGGETELLKALYSPQRLCVADGIDQLTRGQRADWRAGIARSDRTTRNLPTCLRLKRNLSLFVDAIARATGMGWEAEPNPLAGGGRLIVLCKPYADSRDLHFDLVADLKKDGNAPIDMLFCVPPSRVQETENGRHSELAKELAVWGQETWDGTARSTRLDFARSTEQARIVQYASCRGLEGWTVVLDSFDEFLQATADKKRSDGLSPAEAEGLVDLETAAKREAWKWGMIALTRPIDTLVIQLTDKQTGYGREILDVSAQFDDFVTVIE